MLIGPNPLLEAVLVAWPGTLKKDTLVWKTKGSIEEVVKGSQAFQHILICCLELCGVQLDLQFSNIHKINFKTFFLWKTDNSVTESLFLFSLFFFFSSSAAW